MDSPGKYNNITLKKKGKNRRKYINLLCIYITLQNIYIEQKKNFHIRYRDGINQILVSVDLFCLNVSIILIIKPEKGYSCNDLCWPVAWGGGGNILTIYILIK